jgi:hypothetical protein
VNAATRYLSRAIDGTIEVGALHGSLFSAPVLQQVVVRDAEGAIVARIEEIRLSYELTSLVRGILVVDAIDIVRPWLRVAEETDGALNISKLLSIPPADAKPAGTPNPPATHCWPHSPGRPQPRTTAGGIEILPGKTQLDDLHFRMGCTDFTADGVVPWSPQAADFTFHLRPLDMAEVGRLLRHESLQGEVHLGVRAEGPPEALAVSAELSAGGGRLRLQGEVDRASTPAWLWSASTSLYAPRNSPPCIRPPFRRCCRPTSPCAARRRICSSPGG